jgi:membrane protein YdbS with pleckstrin-like domain|tara:strand:+ start:9749 stop:10282 length:534 start_codon:yes stop_codon:yes gene_type:complete
MERLHSGAKWAFRIRGYFSGIPLLFIFLWIGGAVSSFTKVSDVGSGSNILMVSLIMFIIYIIVVITIAEIYARMAYKRWLYEFTPISLKLERGIIWKRYSNIPYERVQNVDVHRGILARMLGFSTVDIQTAGFHMSYGRRGRPRSEGHLPAISVDGAEKIREFLMKKISGKNNGQGM